jgi:hypothetical protein
MEREGAARFPQATKNPRAPQPEKLSTPALSLPPNHSEPLMAMHARRPYGHARRTQSARSNSWNIINNLS